MHSSKQSTSPSVISVHACACMCATAIPKVPAAMTEVLAVGGRMGDTQKGCRGYCRQHSAHFFSLCHSSLGNHGYRRACAFSGLRECEVCVRLSPGCTRDQRALPLSNNSCSCLGGVGRKGIRRWGEQRQRGRVGAEMGGYLQ